MIPLYDLTDSLTIDEGKYNDLFGFIESSKNSRANILIAFIVLTVVFFVLAIVGTIFVCIKKKKQPGSLVENHMTSDYTANQDSDKKYNKLLS